MDYIFPYGSPGDIFWFGEPEVPVIKQSAFVKYMSEPNIDQEFPRKFALGNGFDQSVRDRNMNKRMMAFLKRNPVGRILEDSERERGRRHMISERVRREKQKNSYLALHSILPPKTKNDKNSIIQVAAKEVEELKSLKEDLERQNYELERRILDARKLLGERKDHGGAKIKLKVDYPSSGIDSMLEVLKCLKDKGSNTRAIHSLIATEQFSAVIDIETKKIEAAEVEEAIHRTLYEAERKFRFPYTYK